MVILRKILIIVLFSVGLTACSQGIPGSDSSTPSREAPVEPQPELFIESSDDINITPEVQVEILAAPENADNNPDFSERIITLWHGMDDEGLLALRNIIQAFQRQESEIQVNLVYIPYDDLLDQYVAAVEIGDGPGLFLGAGEWGPGLYGREVIADISQSVPLRLRSEINPAALEMVSQGESLIGLPIMISGAVMYRNTSIVSEAPGSFEAVIASAKDATEGKIVGAYLERGNLFAFPQLEACGGSLMFANGYPAFNSPAGFCWIELLNSFKEAGPVSDNSEDDLSRFKQGRVGIIIDGTWNLEMLSDSLGENLAIDPWPRYKNRHLSGYVWSENIYINPNLDADDRDAALIFSQYLLSQEAQEILSKNGYIPAITDIDLSDSIISQIITALIQGTPYPFQPELKLYFEPLHNAFEAVFKDGVDTAQALEAASDETIKASEDFNTIEGDT